MTALGGIENIRDRAKDDDDAGAQERKYRHQDHRDHRQDQGILNQCLPLFAGDTPGKSYEKCFKESSHGVQ